MYLFSILRSNAIVLQQLKLRGTGRALGGSVESCSVGRGAQKTLRVPGDVTWRRHVWCQYLLYIYTIYIIYIL